MKRDPIARFISHVETETQKHGIKLILHPGSYIEDGEFHYSGYFDEEVLTFACGLPNWINIAAHEFSHFEQWRSKRCKPWKDLYIDINGERMESCDIVGRWLKGEDFKPSTIKLAIRRVQLMELDCERRTYKNFLKFNLPVDTEYHMRGAAAYIHFHNCMRETRKWVKNEYKIWDDEGLLKMMRPNLDYSFEKTSPRVMAYMKKYCV